MTKPDFILIGAMKCGTSTLATQLDAQTGIFMASPKEPNYFSDDEIYSNGSEWYSSLFSAAAPGQLKGEASTHYTKRPELPNTLGRMSEMLPNVKLIYMIRNPLERLVSHYIHEWSQGVLNGTFEEELDSHSPLLDYGRYGWQIAPFINWYGNDAVLLTSLERFTADPNGELQRILKHLEYDGPLVSIKALGADNVSAQRVRRLPLHWWIVENPVATAVRRTIIPKAIRNHIRESRTMRSRPQITLDKKQKLEAFYSEDWAILNTLFPNDPTLQLAYPFLH